MRAQRSILLHKAQSNVNGQMGINAVTNLHLQLDADDSGKLEVVHLLLLPKKKKKRIKNKKLSLVLYHQSVLHLPPTRVYQEPRGQSRCNALQERMALRLVALQKMRPEVKPTKTNRKSPFI